MLAKYGELKGIKDALNKAMVTSCPITYRNQTRMLKLAFIHICLEKRKTKLTGWSSGHHGYEMMYPQCIGCVTGELIAAGKDFPQPAYTEWIEEKECGVAIKPPQREPALFADMIPAMAKAGMIQKKENSMKTENEITTGLPGKFEVFKTLPESFDGLRLPDLRPHWKREPGPNGRPGTCVNCGRSPVTVRHNGVCASCQNACIKKQGQDLLDALQMIRARLMQPESKTRSAAARALRRPAAKAAAPAPAKKTQDVLPPMDNEIAMRSPLHDIGSRYIVFGKMIQNINLTLSELTSAAHELGLSVDIRLTK